MAAIATPFTMSSLISTLGSASSASGIAAATVNDCAIAVDQVPSWVLTTWVGYDHAALPPAPSNFAGNPSSGAAPWASDATQDSAVYMAWDPNCAATYDVGKGSSGGPYSVVSNDQAGVNYSNAMAAATSAYFVVRGNNIGGTPGSWTSEIELRTCPHEPVSFGAMFAAGACDTDYTITPAWTNGTSPGTRNSVVKWRERYKPDGGSYGGWSSFVSTGLGDTSFDYDVVADHGTVVNDDQVQFEAYYDEEGSGTAVTATHTVLCPA